MKTVNFLGYECIVTFEKYNSNQRTAIELTIKETGEPMTTATVNVAAENLLPDEVAIKNYSENEGVLQTLVKAGIISNPLRYINSGFVKIPICKLIYCE